MKKKFLSLLESWPKIYITSSDVSMILLGTSDAIHSLFKRSVKEGILIRIRRDLYLISSKIKDYKPNAFELAPLIYGPSYISFESALGYHGWIPEAVPIITCASSKRSKNFNTIFHVGVSLIKIDKSNMFIADPWKAIADLIYVKKRNWPNIIAFSNDMRIEMDFLQYSDIKLLNKLAVFYPNNRTKLILTKFLKDLDK